MTKHQDTMKMSRFLVQQRTSPPPHTRNQLNPRRGHVPCNKRCQVMSAIIWQSQFHKFSSTIRKTWPSYHWVLQTTQNPLEHPNPRCREYWSSCTPARCLSSTTWLKTTVTTNLFVLNRENICAFLACIYDKHSHTHIYICIYIYKYSIHMFTLKLSVYQYLCYIYDIYIYTSAYVYM